MMAPIEAPATIEGRIPNSSKTSSIGILRQPTGTAGAESETDRGCRHVDVSPCWLVSLPRVFRKGSKDREHVARVLLGEEMPGTDAAALRTRGRNCLPPTHRAPLPIRARRCPRDRTPPQDHAGLCQNSLGHGQIRLVLCAIRGGAGRYPRRRRGFFARIVRAWR